MAAMPRASDPRLVVRLSPELDALLSERVGSRGRAAFARRALEAALGSSNPRRAPEGESPTAVAVSEPAPASPRAPMQSDDQIEAPMKFAPVAALSGAREPSLAPFVCGRWPGSCDWAGAWSSKAACPSHPGPLKVRPS